MLSFVLWAIQKSLRVPFCDFFLFSSLSSASFAFISTTVLLSASRFHKLLWPAFGQPRGSSLAFRPCLCNWCCGLILCYTFISSVPFLFPFSLFKCRMGLSLETRSCVFLSKQELNHCVNRQALGAVVWLAYRLMSYSEAAAGQRTFTPNPQLCVQEDALLRLLDTCLVLCGDSSGSFRLLAFSLLLTLMTLTVLNSTNHQLYRISLIWVYQTVL